jgi:hypothetical protein
MGNLRGKRTELRDSLTQSTSARPVIQRPALAALDYFGLSASPKDMRGR